MINFRSGASSDSTPIVLVSDKAASPFVPEDSATPPAPVANAGAGCNSNSDCCLGKACGCGCGADCDECPGIGIEVFTGVESWRNITNDLLHDTAGPVAGGNIGVPIPVLRDYGIGAQFGASYSAGDLDGRAIFDGESLNNSDTAEQQTFITVGLFRRAFDGDHISSRFSVGIAHDWMIGEAYGYYGQNITLSQWRGQIGYMLNASNEIGVWGTLRDSGAAKFDAYGDQIDYRALNQVNLFWHHNFNSGANSWLYFGMPQQTTISQGGGSLGTFTMGAKFTVPICDRVALYAEGSYMRPSASVGFYGGLEDAYSVGFGLAFYPGGSAATRTVAGNCWMPYLPVANNGSFLVDYNGFEY
jgi:hypothetical protein